jgi:cell division protein FtsB
LHKDACVVVSVKEEELREGVFALLGKYAEAITGGYIRRESMAPVMDAAAESEWKKINTRLSQSGHYLKSLYENLMDGMIDADEFASLKAGYEAEIEGLSRRADDIRKERRDRSSELKSYRAFSGAAAGALSNHELTPDIVDCLVDQVLVNPDKSFEITLRFKDEFGEVLRVGSDGDSEIYPPVAGRGEDR